MQIEWIEIKEGCEMPAFEKSVQIIAERRIESTVLRRQVVSLYWESKLWNGIISREEYVTHWKHLDWPPSTESETVGKESN